MLRDILVILATAAGTALFVWFATKDPAPAAVSPTTEGASEMFREKKNEQVEGLKVEIVRIEAASLEEARLRLEMLEKELYKDFSRKSSELGRAEAVALANATNDERAALREAQEARSHANDLWQLVVRFNNKNRFDLHWE